MTPRGSVPRRCRMSRSIYVLFPCPSSEPSRRRRYPAAAAHVWRPAPSVVVRRRVSCITSAAAGGRTRLSSSWPDISEYLQHQPTDACEAIERLRPTEIDVNSDDKWSFIVGTEIKAVLTSPAGDGTEHSPAKAPGESTGQGGHWPQCLRMCVRHRVRH